MSDMSNMPSDPTGGQPHEGEKPKGPAPVDVPTPPTPAQEEERKKAEKAGDDK